MSSESIEKNYSFDGDIKLVQSWIANLYNETGITVGESNQIAGIVLHEIIFSNTPLEYLSQEIVFEVLKLLSSSIENKSEISKVIKEFSKEMPDSFEKTLRRTIKALTKEYDCSDEERKFIVEKIYESLTNHWETWENHPHQATERLLYQLGLRADEEYEQTHA